MSADQGLLWVAQLSAALYKMTPAEQCIVQRGQSIIMKGVHMKQAGELWRLPEIAAELEAFERMHPEWDSIVQKYLN